jgi:Short repeat of unknown function (DUF308)
MISVSGSARRAWCIWIAVVFIFRGVATTGSAFSTPGLPGRGWAIFVGVTSFIAGVVVLAWPFDSIVILALVAGIWLVVIDVFEIVSAFQIRKAGKTINDAGHARQGVHAARPRDDRSAVTHHAIFSAHRQCGWVGKRQTGPHRLPATSEGAMCRLPHVQYVPVPRDHTGMTGGEGLCGADQVGMNCRSAASPRLRWSNARARFDAAELSPISKLTRRPPGGIGS